MAAIKPHLALDDEASDEQKTYWRCSSSESGLSGPGDDETCPSPVEIANEAHAELMNTAWIRKALVQRMGDRKIWIKYDSDNVPSIAVSSPVKGPAWNPSGGANQTTILGWTTKMGAPSFSLPAGATAMGGACPGATAGQTIASPESRQKQARLIVPVLNNFRGKRSLPVVDRVDVTMAICEFCYAEGGQYSTSGVQNAQLTRFAWANRAINRPGHMPGVSEFYSVMLDAINAADFKWNQEPEQFRSKNMRFFRIHDSGDFFNLNYLAEWKKITLHYHPRYGGEGLRFKEPSKEDLENGRMVVVDKLGKGHPNPVYFWAPTRIWAKGMREIESVSQINGLSVNGKPTWDNFAIRPSAYHIDQHGPFIDLPGWAAPSTVYDKESKDGKEGVAYDWDCKAYAVEKGPSCRGAKNPDDQVGCRVCWVHKDDAVNYTLHL